LSDGKFLHLPSRYKTLSEMYPTRTRETDNHPPLRLNKYRKRFCTPLILREWHTPYATQKVPGIRWRHRQFRSQTSLPMPHGVLRCVFAVIDRHEQAETFPPIRNAASSFSAAARRASC